MMPDFGARYRALDPTLRAEVEGQIKRAYPGAYGGRNVPGPLQWAWECLVTTAANQGVDPDGAFRGSTSATEVDAWERGYERQFAAARAQLEHERTGCPQCAIYASPAPGKTRAGQPCVIGMRYWSVPAGERGPSWEP